MTRVNKKINKMIPLRFTTRPSCKYFTSFLKTFTPLVRHTLIRSNHTKSHFHSNSSLLSKHESLERSSHTTLTNSHTTKSTHKSPSKLTSYLSLIRFYSPTGTLLLFLPCTLGTFIGVLSTLPISNVSTQTLSTLTTTLGTLPNTLSTLPTTLSSISPSLYTSIPLFLTGAFLMRSVGCIINDYHDMRYDSKVERTRNRPLVRGDVGVKEAIGLGVGMCCMLGYC